MNRFTQWATAYPSRLFLLGMLVGAMAMAIRANVVIHQLLNMPVIIAEPVDNAFEKYTRKQTYVVHNCPTKGKNLQIQIRTQAEARAFGASLGYDNPGTLGFTDTENNKIVCVDSIEILIHEIRHIFEGSYHRNLPQGAIINETGNTSYNS